VRLLVGRGRANHFCARGNGDGAHLFSPCRLSSHLLRLHLDFGLVDSGGGPDLPFLAMPSLHQRSGTSNASLSRSNTGTALRRGELKISDPIPSGQGESVFASSNTTPPSFLVTGPSVQDGTWPRQTPPASFRVRSGSGGRVDIAKGARVSEGPSLVPSSMSTVPSRTSLTQKKQGGGFRATIKRVFGGKRHRSVSYGDNQKDYHRSVCSPRSSPTDSID